MRKAKYSRATQGVATVQNIVASSADIQTTAGPDYISKVIMNISLNMSLAFNPPPKNLPKNLS